MANVIMYGTLSCPYCVRARGLLERKSVEYQWIDVSRDTALFHEMVQLSGGSSVPQIFIEQQSIGGCDEMHALEHQGRLDEMLGLN